MSHAPHRALPWLLGVALLPAAAAAQDLVTGPYLQSAEPTRIWVAWETSSGDQSRVEWGPTPELGQVTDGAARRGFLASRHHEVELTELAPGTRYHYRVVTGDLVGEIHHFQTPPAPEAEAVTRLVAVSDMQRDGRNRDVFRRIVDEGIIPTARARFDDDLARALSLVLVPGDLVDNGLLYGQWADQFFGPAQRLLRHVPVYPVLGNHEINAPAYFDYFRLPENGTPGFDEHWYYLDHSNLRVIGLDSNPLFRLPVQLEWLDEVLADACADDTLDFVFAQLHHPFHSELWPAGNTDYTGDVIERLEGFTADCGKPSVHFYGHTHGYSRGQSRDHQHLMVNVASAGGNLDYWGEYAQTNYPEHTVSQDEYGFVFVEVSAGDDPHFVLERYSQGQPDAPLDNVLRDEITVRIVNAPPDPPADGGPLGDTVNPECFTVGLAPFVDADGDDQQATHWQVAEDGADGCDFAEPVRDVWRQRQDWFDDEDLQAGDDLNDEVFEGLRPGQPYCWRARVRDSNLRWSAWSAPARFTTRGEGEVDLPLVNPGAEQGTAPWRVEAGILEAVEDGECAGGDPFQGRHHFSVGGVCDSAALGRASQRVDVAAHAQALDAGEAVLRFGGHLRTYNGSDRPDLWLRFLDAQGEVLGETEPVGTGAARWTLVRDEAAAPLGTRAVELVLRGRRNAGTDNDSYFDGLYLRLGEPQGCDGLPEPPEPEPDAGAPEPDMAVVDPDMAVADPDMAVVDPDMAVVDPDGGPDLAPMDPDLAVAEPDLATVDLAVAEPDLAARPDQAAPDASPPDADRGPALVDAAPTDAAPSAADGGPGGEASVAGSGCRAAPAPPPLWALLCVLGLRRRRRGPA